jgi:hypothetical protein
MNHSDPALSEEACCLIATLVASMRDSDSERRRLWPNHPVVRELARERGLRQRLLVPSPNWVHEVLLDLEGRMLVRLDTAGGEVVERSPNALEAHLAWHRYIPGTWPELSIFAPPKPVDAVVCPGCGGHGFQPDPDGPHANVSCICGNTGWLPAEALGMDAFLDFAPGSSEPVPARQTRPSMWQRLVKRISR